MTPPGGRPALDGAPRIVKIMVRMTERDRALIEALRGAVSMNQYILDALRQAARNEVK
jgi:predicted HicB family RNase H-like nuclease